jgi:hypothetical protein
MAKRGIFNAENFLFFAIAFNLGSISIATICLTYIAPFFPPHSIVDNAISFAIVFIPSILAIVFNIGKISFKVLLFYMSITILFCLYYIITPFNQSVLFSIYITFIINTFAIILFITMAENRIDLIIKAVRFSGIICFIAYFNYTLFLESFANGIFSYMSFSYDIMPAAIICTYFGLTRKSYIEIIMGIICITEIIIFGARGTVVAYALFLILLILFGFKKINWLIVAMVSILSTASYLFLSNKILIYNFISFLNINYHIKSRTLDQILTNKITDDSGRSIIQQPLLDALYNNWFTGLGIGSDRGITGGYAHNVFIEILIDFGVIFGSAIFIYLGYILYKMLIKCKDPSWKGIFIIFASMAFGELLFSSSFWFDSNFFVAFLIAFICFSAHNNKQKTDGVIISPRSELNVEL